MPWYKWFVAWRHAIFFEGGVWGFFLCKVISQFKTTPTLCNWIYIISGSFNPITFTTENMFSMSYMFQCIIEGNNNVYHIFIVFRLCTKPTRSTGLLWNIDKIYKIYKPRRRNKYAIIFILYIDLTSVSLNLYCIFTVICYYTKPARSGCG